MTAQVMMSEQCVLFWPVDCFDLVLSIGLV
jgi:hypothetical protein